MSMTTKEEIHRLVDDLPAGELSAARRYLEYLRDLGDPVFRALVQSPYDDEPETDEERSAVEEGKQAMERGDTITSEELQRRLSQ